MNYPRMPKRRPDLKRRRKKTKEEIDHQLNEGLKESFPASDPPAAIAPGGPVEPDEDPARKRSGPE